MKQLLFFIISIVTITGCNVKSQNVTFVIYSQAVKDSFDITIHVNTNQDNKQYKVVYYLDANLRSGKTLQELIKSPNDSIRQNTIYVGIGHRGNYRVKRRRDFIPPVLNDSLIIQSNNPDYGHADAFYNFLQNELIPFVETKYSVTQERTIIGHSFGGLFAFYALLHKNPVFNNYIALSPSFWINDYNILSYEAQFYKSNASLPYYLFMSAGDLEQFNRILRGNNKMKQLLEQRSYPEFRFENKVFPGKTHHSQVSESLKYLLDQEKI